MERTGALFTLEGASGSGRRELAEALADDGFIVVPGISRYPERNKLLTPKARAALEGVNLDLSTILKLPTHEKKARAELGINVLASQFDECLRLVSEGNIVFLTSSGIRLANIFWMNSAKAFRAGNEEEARLSYDMIEKAMKATPLVDHVSGIVVMTDVYRGADGRNAQIGVNGLAETESLFLQRTVLDIKFSGFPVCGLDPNRHPLDVQRERVRAFTTKP